MEKFNEKRVKMLTEKLCEIVDVIRDCVEEGDYDAAGGFSVDLFDIARKFDNEISKF